MSLSRFDTFARSVVGPSAAGAQVFLCLQPVVTTSLPPSPLAQLYSDPLGANPISQPLVCDGFGHASCYVSSGTFTEVVVYGGMLVQVYPDQFISSTIAVQVNGLEVNGNPVTGPNFNSTVPATPVGSTTVIWQFDGLGNVTGSIPTSIYAPIASPAFTGTPTAPTPASSDDSNTIATTAYVQSVLAGSGLVVSVFGRTGAVEAASGDYTVAQITGAAPLASPALTGTPTAPTPATADSSTLLATTAFVKAQGYGVGSVTTFSAANIGGIATASVTNPTSTPALTFTLEAQAANTVWAGPTTGSNAAPTFRALVASDIPGGSSIAPNEQAGSTYTIQNSDLGKVIVFSDTAEIAVTLPQAGVGGNFSSGWFCYVENSSIGFAATITPTTSTINGQSTLILYPGLGGIIFCDGTNFFASVDTVGTNVMATSLSAGTQTGVGGVSASKVAHAVTVQSISSTAPRLQRGVNIFWEGDLHQGSADYDGLQVVANALMDSGSSNGTHVVSGSFTAMATSPLGSPATLNNLDGVRVQVNVDTNNTVVNGVSFISYLPWISGNLTNYYGFYQDAPSGNGAGVIGTWYSALLDFNLNNIPTVTTAIGISAVNVGDNTCTNSFGVLAGGKTASIVANSNTVQGSFIGHANLSVDSPPVGTLQDGWYSGTGSPNGQVTAVVGSFYSQRDGGSGTTFWVKESGSGNTGWVGK